MQLGCLPVQHAACNGGMGRFKLGSNIIEPGAVARGYGCCGVLAALPPQDPLVLFWDNGPTTYMDAVSFPHCPHLGDGLC